MRIEHCEFPDDLLYDEDGLVWVRPDASGLRVVGITSIQAALAGPLTKVAAKPAGIEYARGKSVGTLESGRYFGAIRLPMEATLLRVNESVLANPKLLSSDPYGRGWFAEVRPKEATGTPWLRSAADVRDRLAAQVAALRVHCFAAFPDHEMFEIGTECAAVMAKLDELLTQVPTGDVVHLVSDDWTAPAEMVNWSMRTGQPILEQRKEGNLYHFLVRKVG